MKPTAPAVKTAANVINPLLTGGRWEPMGEAYDERPKLVADL
jgi:hypothetical protein